MRFVIQKQYNENTHGRGIPCILLSIGISVTVLYNPLYSIYNTKAVQQNIQLIYNIIFVTWYIPKQFVYQYFAAFFTKT